MEICFEFFSKKLKPKFASGARSIAAICEGKKSGENENANRIYTEKKRAK